MFSNNFMYKNNFLNLKNRTKLRLFIPSTLLHGLGPDGWITKIKKMSEISNVNTDLRIFFNLT